MSGFRTEVFNYTAATNAIRPHHHCKASISSVRDRQVSQLIITNRRINCQFKKDLLRVQLGLLVFFQFLWQFDNR